ncbi:TetR/AcrR family transcriptional regulator [Streptomyces mutabilis]|uniref:TetR/AcrR family transcriptional regulator n=1 Tax=Streptomyces TaxID=1883 RepID=UPI000BCCB9BA|nr:MULTISPECIES: TetR/AcrR family transcriptional regulator [Streptomyces]MCZ9351907.1 TetR/AcrR family transcriptional regulator [Streptomyces mutabilis]MDG9688988.1 TetR/AcrR family transcriptional regulator [Streptomyces sp. DH17]MDN3244244.1 TetR/AcrR family transcriptional regulator [Streptomyces sp. ZSW22]PAM99582.1 TetR family transcriptional regulator [Streptomyces sp. Alain-F2R5]
MTTPESAAPPLRRRGEPMRRAVLAAAVDLLSTQGLAGTTVGAVARSAGVHETSVYRRWGTRENLILDALTTELDSALPVPDTGCVRDDLLGFFSSLAALLGTAQGRALLRLSVENDDTLEDRRGPYWSERLDRAVVMVRRGVDRGELAADTDPALLVEAVSGPLFVRVLLSGAPLDEALVRGLVDLALEGALPRPE